jgi:Flp pilus assembly protein protease CpaA
MFELLIPALVASAAAGLWDLKTTEVPDEIPALMISVGLFYWIFVAMTSGNFIPLVNSIILGTIILVAGLVLYKKGQWGGADAWILASIFYMVPSLDFFAGYILNFFIISIVYMLAYSVLLGIRNRDTWKHYKEDLKRSWKYVVAIPAIFIAAVAAFSLAISEFSFVASAPFAGISFLVFLMALFWRYGVVVEKHVFRRKVSTSRLKAGDVLEKGIWVGLTKEEVKKIKANKRYVVIKEGVRFVPVFPITLAVTIFGTLLPIM